MIKFLKTDLIISGTKTCIPEDLFRFLRYLLQLYKNKFDNF